MQVRFVHQSRLAVPQGVGPQVPPPSGAAILLASLGIAALRFAALGFAALGFAAGAQAAPACPAAISPLNARFLHDMRAKNRSDVLFLYTADAHFIQPDGSVVERAGLPALCTRVFSQFDSDLTLMPDLAPPASSQAAVRCTQTGAWTETLTDRATGTKNSLHGHYVFEYRRAGPQQWRYTSQHWLDR